MNTTQLLRFLPLDKHARAEWILYALHQSGHSIAALSSQHGVKRSSACQCLRIPMPKWERIIADALGVRPEQLWPERYGPDGKPNRKRGRPLGYSPKKHKAQQDAAQYQEWANH